LIIRKKKKKKFNEEGEALNKLEKHRVFKDSDKKNNEKGILDKLFQIWE
jgi:hypothetical protein